MTGKRERCMSRLLHQREEGFDGMGKFDRPKSLFEIPFDIRKVRVLRENAYDRVEKSISLGHTLHEHELFFAL
jgi:hypothetical protein